MENKHSEYLSQIQFGHESRQEKDRLAEWVFAKDEDNELSYLEYHWADSMQSWYLADLWTDEEVRGRGLAGRLFQEFVKRVGVDQPVYVGCVIHEPSIPPLRQFYEASRSEDVSLRGEVIENVKLAQFMGANGVRIEEIVVSYDPDKEEQDGTDDINYTISFFGRT